jgi:Tfp pilus assembly protein PilN
MNLLDWLEKTRKKPEKDKYRIALGLALVITATVMIIWLSISFVSKTEHGGNLQPDPFSIIKDFFKFNF